MKAGETAKESRSQTALDDSNERHFAQKEAWKNQPGNRFTPEQVVMPGQLREWKWTGPKEVHIWPCP